MQQRLGELQWELDKIRMMKNNGQSSSPSVAKKPVMRKTPPALSSL
jgi:hypothetical protein